MQKGHKNILTSPFKCFPFFEHPLLFDFWGEQYLNSFQITKFWHNIKRMSTFDFYIHIVLKTDGAEHSVIWSRSKCRANRFVYCLSTQKQNCWVNKRTCGSGKKYLFQFVLPRLSWLVRRAYLVQYADDPISQDWIETRWLACLVWFHIRFTHSRYFRFRDLLLFLVPMPHFANALKLPQHFLLPHFLIWKANFKGSYLYVSL